MVLIPVRLRFAIVDSAVMLKTARAKTLAVFTRQNNTITISKNGDMNFRIKNIP